MIDKVGAAVEAVERYPHDGSGKTEVQLARLLGLREGYIAGRIHGIHGEHDAPGAVQMSGLREIKDLFDGAYLQATQDGSSDPEMEAALWVFQAGWRAAVAARVATFGLPDPDVADRLANGAYNR